ncbi:hypothetical protein IJ096_00915 [Candidatus Saccharibacteria bacterium]|nr:hypothetical protein [Candidatus Saccharibacteria bacterium]
MLKAVVFDSGWGGEMFADYLEERMPVVEVIRVIDWRRAPYGDRGRAEICVMVDKVLQPFIGEADVIVLASYAVTVAALSYLRWKYPEQKFVGFEMGLSDYVVEKKNYSNTVMVLATGVVEKSASFMREMLTMRGKHILRPDCAGWTKLVDDGEMTERKLREYLDGYLDMKIDVILPYSTGFLDLKPMLEKIYGRGVVVNDFARVFQQVCVALGLRGGGYSKTALRRRTPAEEDSSFLILK